MRRQFEDVSKRIETGGGVVVEECSGRQEAAP